MHDLSAPGGEHQVHAPAAVLDLTTEWASMLQQMVANEVPVDEASTSWPPASDRQLEGRRSGLIPLREAVAGFRRRRLPDGFGPVRRAAPSAAAPGRSAPPTPLPPIRVHEPPPERERRSDAP